MSEKSFANNLKRFWDKFWFLVWKDDSFKGWILSLVFIFIIIKFIFFPGLSFITSTELPLAIVESCSMYHNGNLLSDFGEWFDDNEAKYSAFGIEKTEFQEFRMKNGFNKGDILLITGVKPENIEIGEIIIFSSGNSGTPIIHRVVSIERKVDGQGNLGFLTFSTMGDNNNGQLNSELSISEGQIIGKAMFKIAPYLGWIKLVFYEPFKTSSDMGFCE
ncbi:signal peptidase I [Candidatus Pacearchaeota archaeon]|nr:signal peptidase I [Candidatus Pacearchaeota archaeon]